MTDFYRQVIPMSRRWGCLLGAWLIRVCSYNLLEYRDPR